MATYELMLVSINDKADQLLGRVEKFIKDANGESVKVERLGKKQLAYQIKKQTDATYFVVSFQAEGEAVKPIWDKLRLEQEDLLRYLLLRKEEKKGKKAAKVADEVEVAKEEEKKPKVTVVTKKVSKNESAEVSKKKIAKVAKVKSKGKKGNEGKKKK